MRLFTLSLFILVVSMLGCSAENPVCSTNFCAIGEVFPRSELEDGQAFSEVDIDDSVIFATLIGGDVNTTPVGTTLPSDAVTLDDIVSDVASGGTTYTGKIVTMTATVALDASAFESKSAVTLVTNNEDVIFFIVSRDNPAKLANYKEGLSYTFDLFIRQIEPPLPSFPEYAVWADIPTEKVSVDFSTLVADVAVGGRGYIDKIVTFRAVVGSDQTVFDPSDTISLVTNEEDISFFVSNRTEGVSLMKKYRQGQTYQFTVFIRDIKPGLLDKGFNIWSHIVVE